MQKASATESVTSGRSGPPGRNPVHGRNQSQPCDFLPTGLCLCPFPALGARLVCGVFTGIGKVKDSNPLHSVGPLSSRALVCEIQRLCRRSRNRHAYIQHEQGASTTLRYRSQRVVRRLLRLLIAGNCTVNVGALQQ